MNGIIVHVRRRGVEDRWFAGRDHTTTIELALAQFDPQVASCIRKSLRGVIENATPCCSTTLHCEGYDPDGRIYLLDPLKWPSSYITITLAVIA